ncbi:MAG: VWA domain-containing protein [Planctomycetota bacterium]
MTAVLLVLPLVAILFAWLRRQRGERERAVVGRRWPQLSDARPTRGLLFLTALACALVAALKPAWGESTVAAPAPIDVMICLDVSRSMLAEDVRPNRLQRARAELNALADALGDDRIGLVAFAGEARLVVPLTRDVESFRELAEGVGTLSVRRGGTDLAAAIRTATRALTDAGSRRACILLVTDGEDHAGAGATAARISPWPTHVLALGTELGAKIPVEGGFLRDRAGNEVVTRLDPASLEALVDAGDGRLYDAGDALTEVLAEEQRTTRAGEPDRRAQRYQWPLLAAVLLWLVDLGRRRTR